MDSHYLINYKPYYNDSFSLVTNNDDMNEREFKKINNKKKGSLGNEKRVVKLSTDPQSVAARERRHKISERFKILRSLVPGGTKMDTASMLEEAIQYVKFLKAQIWLHQAMINKVDHHHHHHVLASDQQYHLSSQENDYLVMTQMYGHACFYDHHQFLEDAMSFDTSINYN